MASPIVDDIKQTPVPKVASLVEATADKNIFASKTATPVGRPDTFNFFFLNWTTPEVDDNKPSAKSVISSSAQSKISCDFDWTTAPAVESTLGASSSEPLETIPDESVKGEKPELGQLTRIPSGTFWNNSRPAFARTFNYQQR